jgi:hypothetical protein
MKKIMLLALLLQGCTTYASSGYRTYYYDDYDTYRAPRYGYRQDLYVAPPTVTIVPPRIYEPGYRDRFYAPAPRPYYRPRRMYNNFNHRHW